jgi:hypothetical protein
MSFVAVAVGGAAVAGIGGAVISSNAAGNAAQTQAGATQTASADELAAQQAALAQQQSQFNTLQANEQPWMQAGQTALAGLANPSFQQPFTMADFQQDPSYQFDLGQGTQAIEQAAAAQGGLKSGGLLKSIAQYTQGMASNDYEQAFNNYQTQQNANFGRLSTIAGFGAQATGQMAQVGMNSANAQSGIIQAGGNAQASLASSLGNSTAASQIAQGNIVGGTLSSLGSQLPSTMIGAQNANTLSGLMKGMYPQPTPGVTSPMTSPIPTANTALGDYAYT